MTGVDIAVIVLVVLIFAASITYYVRKKIKEKRTGIKTACCGCEGCSLAGRCDSSKPKE